jgi:TetR/AcrR family transcriptional regulator
VPRVSSQVGRPRARSRASNLSARDEIVAVASRLFAAKGVGGTTMAEIADGAGLQQSSLYYYFKSREEILAVILADVNRVPLDYVEQLRAEGGSAVVRLYRLVCFDVAALCRFPFDINEVHRLAAEQPEQFPGYWQERQLLIEQVEALLGEGIAAGDLVPCDPRLAALTVLANDEAVQHWRRPPPGRKLAKAYTPETVGAFLADLTVRGLLVRPARLAAIRRAAGVR